MSFKDIANSMAQAADALQELQHPSNDGSHCSQCLGRIEVMSFKGTGVCCELCRKREAGEISEESYTQRFVFGRGVIGSGR